MGCLFGSSVRGIEWTAGGVYFFVLDVGLGVRGRFILVFFGFRDLGKSFFWV